MHHSFMLYINQVIVRSLLLTCIGVAVLSHRYTC